MSVVRYEGKKTRRSNCQERRALCPRNSWWEYLYAVLSGRYI